VSSNEDEFLRDLVRDVLRKIDEVDSKMDDRIEFLHDRIGDSADDLRECVFKKLEPLEAQVHEHSLKLNRHEHNFTLLTFIVTAGAATLSGWFNWVSQLFNGSHK
jgi:hypothetical protein